VTAWRDARGAIARLGGLDGSLYVASRALAKLSAGRVRLHQYRFVAQRVAAAPLLREGAGRAIEVAIVVPDDPIVASFPRPPEVIRRRFAAGGVCFVARSHGRFAGFLWLQHGRYVEDEVRAVYVTLPAERTAWDYDVYVDPEFRMGRTFLRLWDAAFAYLRERGVEWTMSRIHVANAASLRAHAHFAARGLANAVFLAAGPAQVALLSSAPYVHASWRTHAPVLTFNAPCER
jgi:hypothetical protein